MINKKAKSGLLNRTRDRSSGRHGLTVFSDWDWKQRLNLERYYQM